MARTLYVNLIPVDSKTLAEIKRVTLTYIGMIEGIRYFEHPIYGDESPLICIINGTWYQSEDWEV